MSNKTLEHGQIKGLRCPYCKAAGGFVAQRLEQDSNPLGGLSAHMRTVHPELYEAWVATFKTTG